MEKKKEESVVVRAAKYEQVVNDLKLQQATNEILIEALNQAHVIMELGDELMKAMKLKYSKEIDKRDAEIERLQAVIKTLIGK